MCVCVCERVCVWVECVSGSNCLCDGGQWLNGKQRVDVKYLSWLGSWLPSLRIVTAARYFRPTQTTLNCIHLCSFEIYLIHARHFIPSLLFLSLSLSLSCVFSLLLSFSLLCVSCYCFWWKRRFLCNLYSASHGLVYRSLLCSVCFAS